MKKNITVALCLALATCFASCQKDENDVTATPNPIGVPMTLQASLAGDGTKATVTPLETGGLKTTWDAGDKISVLTLDASGNLKYNDVFTLTTGAGTTNADFAGTYTGGSVADAQVVCYYPALAYSDAEGLKSSETSYATIKKVNINASQGYYLTSYQSQVINNSTLAVENGLIMSGDAIITEGVLTTTLNNRIAVLKIIVRGDKSAFNGGIQGFDLKTSRAVLETHWDDAQFTLATTSGFMANNTAAATDWYISNSSFTFEPEVDLVLYQPIVLNPAQAGDVWTIRFTAKGAKTLQATKTFSKAFTFEPGVCYPISFNAEEFAPV